MQSARIACRQQFLAMDFLLTLHRSKSSERSRMIIAVNFPIYFPQLLWDLMVVLIEGSEVLLVPWCQSGQPCNMAVMQFS